MIRALAARLRQGHRTARYPTEPPVLPDRYRGRPELHPERCQAGCEACSHACPTGAIAAPGTRLDLGRCLGCGSCSEVCQHGVVTWTGDHRMAVRRREELELGGTALQLATALEERTRRLLGRALKLRQVSAGGCNACEADINVLSTVGFDLSRFGIAVVASPRHADGLIVTGPVPANMRLGLEKTWAATPSPRIVVAVGACAISGGPFAGHPEVHDGVGSILPVDLFVPGCPPHPYTILDGLLRLLGRLG